MIGTADMIAERVINLQDYTTSKLSAVPKRPIY